MTPDDFKRAWHSQSATAKLSISADLLLNEVRRNERHFAAMIFWRDAREVGAALVMIPVWFYLGIKLSLPWTWYLMVPAILWIAGYLLVDRIRYKRYLPRPSEPLYQHVKVSLAQIEHQIWLLRNILWWYLLPIAIAALAFLIQRAWQDRAGGWIAIVAVGIAFSIGLIILAALAAVYWLNQNSVRSVLEPRRQELQTLLDGLNGDELPPA